MPKKARQKRSVKPPQDAPVTRASAEAATGDGDGGRVLGQLDTNQRKKARKLLGAQLERELHQKLTALDRQERAEPEPATVAASAGAARVRELPPSTGGAVPLRDEWGGRPRLREQPMSRAARIRRDQRRAKRTRAQRPRMVQLLLPVAIRAMDLEHVLRGEVIEAIAAVLLRPWDDGAARIQRLEEA